MTLASNRTTLADWRLLVAAPWLKRLLFAASIVIIAWQWTNTRIATLRLHQPLSAPVVLSGYYVYHSMAAGFREGRVGQVDLEVLRHRAQVNDPWAPFERLPPGAAHQWVPYYTLDIGYSLIVELARLAFPTLPDNHLRALALQLFVDAALVAIVFFLFSQWHAALGLLAAYLFASHGVFSDLVSFAFYYYWDIPFAFIVLGALLLAYRRPAQATWWLTLAALVLGCGVWVRGSWWPISLFLCGVAASAPALRRRLVLPMIVFAVVAAPQVVRSSLARGQLTFTTRAVWHVALVGLGYYPNPYGLKDNDGAIFALTRQKYGVEFRSEDYFVHDQAAKKEFFAIWQKDPGFVIRSFLGRLKESVAGTTQTSVLSFLFVSNLTYRVLCLIGLILMVIRGGDRRLLGIAAAGTYLVYVLLTCAFYFVGLAYDNVSEVTLFILFMGLFDSVLYYGRRALDRFPAFASAEPAASLIHEGVQFRA